MFQRVISQKHPDQLAPDFLQWLVNEVLAGVDFANFSIESFVAHVARLHRQPIVLVPTTMPPETTLYGVLLRNKKQTFLFYEAETAPFHQWLIILHELSHIILRHPLKAIDENTNRETLFAHYQRSYPFIYNSVQEQQTEQLARELFLEIIRRSNWQKFTNITNATPQGAILFTALIGEIS